MSDEFALTENEIETPAPVAADATTPKKLSRFAAWRVFLRRPPATLAAAIALFACLVAAPFRALHVSIEIVDASHRHPRFVRHHHPPVRNDSLQTIWP